MSIFRRLKSRPLLQSDLPQLIEIEKASFCLPWKAEDFAAAMGQSNTFGTVFEISHKMAGYLVVAVSEESYSIANLCVVPQFRRQGLGTSIVKDVIASAARKGRSYVFADVSERNVAAQLFLRSLGFYCVATLQEFYDADQGLATGEACYTFRVHVLGHPPKLVKPPTAWPVSGKNRISDYSAAWAAELGIN